MPTKNKQPQEYTCEVCGAPATHFVRDLFKRDNIETGLKEFLPNGDFHAFCQKHRRDSEMIDITESPLTWFHSKITLSDT